MNKEGLTSANNIPVNPDTSIDAIVNSLAEEGNLFPDEVTRELMMKQYEEYYGQYYQEANQSQTDKRSKEAEKALKKLQSREEKAAESEVRPKNPILWSEAYQKEFVADYLANQERERLDRDANLALNMAANDFLDATANMQMRAAIADEQKKAEDLCRMNEAILYMANNKFEYLTRGATLACTCGAMWRRLNLPNSHGIFYGETEEPVINKEDNQVGDAFNITNFGLCAGSNPPNNPVVLEDMVFTDEMGRFMAPQEEDTVKRGNGCIPEIIKPGWQESYKRTQMGGAEKEAVSTKSFLVCLHGGIIYPINSGQHSNLVVTQEDDAELNSTFDQLCTEYRNLQKESVDIMSNIMDYDDKQLYQNIKKREACAKKMELCLDRARDDGYRNEYADIPLERRNTINHMLEEYTKLTKDKNAKAPGLKSDYYSYRRRNGFTADSDYNRDEPGFSIGSDAYTDWRAGRLENKKKKEATAEFKAWEEDVNRRGYDQLTQYEKEEFDKAKKKYGN